MSGTKSVSDLPTRPPANMPGAGRMPGNGMHARFMTVEKPSDFKGTIRRLWHYFGAERLFFVFCFVLVGASALISLLAPYMIGRIVDVVSAKNTPDMGATLRLLCLSLLALYFLNFGFSLAQGWIMAGLSQRIVARIRMAVFRRFQQLPLSYFDSKTHGELMSRLSNDIDNISSTIASSTLSLMSIAITIIGSLFFMLLLSPLLSIAVLAMLPLILLHTTFITKHTKSLYREQQAGLGRLNGHIEETIAGFPVVLLFGRQRRCISDFDELNKKYRTSAVKANIWSGFLMPIINVINNLGFGCVAVFGGILALGGSVTVGVIASFLSYSRQFSRPINDLANIYNTLQSAVASAERVFEVLDEAEEPPDPLTALPLTDVRGDIEFEHVDFSYKPGVPVLSDITFDVKGGSAIAFVGRTGAGKTTIINLLARFYDTTAGSIRIDGRDIKDYTRTSLRSAFGVVLQEPFLFTATIRENIRYGRPDATDTEIEAAAEKACADRFIRRLSKGYDTVLSTGAGNISQGQRQLLSIARAILANTPILILDEATSSVDTRTEQMIQRAMLSLMKGRTSFLIAHRLSTIRDCANIIVIEDGRIAEQGTHEQLIEQDGIYAEMYRSQTGH